VTPKSVRCALYTRKSTEHNLDLEFNSLHAQRESYEAYIKSQMHEGWVLIPDPYDDGGISGASLDRPDLQRLLGDIAAGKVDNVVVYKVDRLTRSLTDFAKLVELFDTNGVSFVSVTQAFNTTSSMGRLSSLPSRKALSGFKPWRRPISTTSTSLGVEQTPPTSFSSTSRSRRPG
jgi:site-specific DNA recombinase